MAFFNRKRHTFIQTYSGYKIDFADLDYKQIQLVDIAKGLERQHRFAGQLNTEYTVADHSINVANIYAPILPDQTPSLAQWLSRLAALMHDAAEAYMGDMPAPLKSMIGGKYAAIEFKIQNAICKRFNLSYPHVPWNAEISKIDQALCGLEALKFFDYEPIDDWNLDMPMISGLHTSNIRIYNDGTWLSMVEACLAGIDGYDQ